MQSISLALAGQVSEPIEVGPGARVTATGSGRVEWAAGTLADARNGVVTWQNWPRGASVGVADTLRRVLIRGVATGALTIRVQEGFADPGEDTAYWQQDAQWVTDANGNPIGLRGPRGETLGGGGPQIDAGSDPAAVIAAADRGGVVTVVSDVSAGATAPLDPGVDFHGERGVFFQGASGGRQLVNRPGRGPEFLEWGRENLVRWLSGLRTGATLKVALVGDSNTAGHVGAQLATYLDSLPNVAISNFGVSGTNIEQWRTAAAPYNANGLALSDVVTYAPDLIVMCWGTNDPLAARTAEDFETSLIAALTTLRASLSIHACSIALLTPNAMGTASSGQDELFNLQIRPIIRSAAERFVCAYFDKNALFPNSSVDLSAGAMQNQWYDSFRVHTTPLSTAILAAMIAEWLVPRELWSLVWDNAVQRASADLPSAYPPGLSIARMVDGQFNGFVATFNPINTAGHFPAQLNWASAGGDTRLAFRAAVGGSWSAWAAIGPSLAEVVGSIAVNYELAGGAQSMNTRRDAHMVSLSGRLTRSPAGHVVTATILANIANTAHRPIFNIQDAVIVALNAGGTVERLRADVTTAGNIVARENSVMSDATTVSINLTYRGA